MANIRSEGASDDGGLQIGVRAPLCLQSWGQGVHSPCLGAFHVVR